MRNVVRLLLGTFDSTGTDKPKALLYDKEQRLVRSPRDRGRGGEH